MRPPNVQVVPKKSVLSRRWRAGDAIDAASRGAAATVKANRLASVLQAASNSMCKLTKHAIEAASSKHAQTFVVIDIAAHAS